MRYEVHTNRSGRWWAIDVPSEPGVYTQARRLDQVKTVAADALSLWFTAIQHQKVVVSPDQIDLSIRPGAALDRAFAKAKKNVEAADRARAESAAAVRAAVAAAKDAGLPVRDIGTLLGLSFQRAAVLLREARKAA